MALRRSSLSAYRIAPKTNATGQATESSLISLPTNPLLEEHRDCQHDAMSDMRAYLRAFKVFTGDLPEFDPEAVPATPEALFVEWLYAAVEAGVREPHAMTLSTLGTDGMPAGRVLVLKNIDEEAGSSPYTGKVPKGRI